MNPKRILLAVVLVCFAIAAHAQRQSEEDKISITDDYGKSKATGTRFDQQTIKFRMPIKTDKKKSHFIIGAEAGILKVQNSASVADSTTLKTVGIIFGYQTVLESKARLSITAEPLISADVINITSSDFRFRRIYFMCRLVCISYHSASAWPTNTSFSGSQILPVIIPIWRISDKVTLTGAFPIIPRLEVKLDQHWSIGAGLNVNYNTYRLSGFNNQYLQTQNLSVGFTPKYRAGKHLEISSFWLWQPQA